MGFIRKKKCGFVPQIANIERTELVRSIVSEENEDGGITQKVVFQETPMSVIEKQLPDADIYTLENLIKAGVDLKTIPVGHLLDSTDITELDALRDYVSQKYYNQLLDLDYKDKVEEDKLEIENKE